MEQVAAAFDPPPAHTPATAFSAVDDLSMVRQVACDFAAASGLARDRIAALEVAVSEVATNTLRHTSAGGTIRMWTDNGSLICEITDRGTFLPVQPRAAQQSGGWGLDIATDLSDGFALHSVPGRSLWRLTFRL